MMFATHECLILCRWQVDIWVFCQVLSTRAIGLTGRNYPVSWHCADNYFVEDF